MSRTPELPFSYRAYGCNLVSDMPLVRLLPGTDAGLDTITVRRTDALPEVPEAAVSLGADVWAAPDFVWMDIDGVVRLVALGGDTLLYQPAPGANDVTVQLFLMGSGLGAILMQRNLLVIHGNAFEINGACVMCVGPSGIGKSTTAAGLLQRGYRVMSDDICAINDAGLIIPGMPHVKLWQEAADALGVDTAALDRVRPSERKYGVPLGDAFCQDQTPVTRVYHLTTHADDTVLCEPLTAHEKFMVLRENTYRLPFVAGMGLASDHFQQLVSLSQRVSVSRIARPSEGFHLDALLDILIADAEAGDVEA